VPGDPRCPALSVAKLVSQLNRGCAGRWFAPEGSQHSCVPFRKRHGPVSGMMRRSEGQILCGNAI